MGNLKGVNIQRGRLGANRVGNDDAISGIIITSPVVSNLEFDTPVVVYNMTDVEDFGITKDFDENQNVHVWQHLKEFFRLAGAGTELHLMIVEQTESMSDCLSEHAKALLLNSDGKIKQLAVAVNLDSEAVVTSLDGLPVDVIDAISTAKALELWSEENFMPVSVFLEGHHFSGNAASAIDLRAIESLSAEGVSVVIGQDYEVAKSKLADTHARNYAFVGTALGVTASCFVQQNIGENETKNLTNGAKKELISAGLSSFETIKAKFDDLQTLEDKGYIFGVTYAGMAGVRLNNDHVCSPIVLDSDNSINEHTIAYGRVGKKARRELRRAYLPKVKTNWTVDEKTGKLSPGTIVALEAIGNQVLADMLKRGEITAGETWVDPASDLIVEKILKVSYKIVPRGSIGEITGFINLKTQL
jgi:hypothetical protein